MPFAATISLVASAALLVAYGLLNTGKLTPDDYAYQWLNAIGAAALTYSVIKPFNVGVSSSRCCGRSSPSTVCSRSGAPVAQRKGNRTMPAAAIISLIGSAFFILAFGALNFGLVTVDNYAYQIANTAGAACFTYTAIQPFNPGLFITEFLWFVFGLYGIYKIVMISRKKRSTTQS
ncbi:MAG: CBU_0592 family membrane protein [Corynebacterium pyruviciproducens]|uniref:CBU_0592 family membrane protein n=2 Tax=Corynebacterium pyruviciproducens TaxID=598660 RepID=UPI003983D587